MLRRATTPSHPRSNPPWRAISQPGTVTVGDFNGDGKMDLAVGDEHSPSVLVFLGNGDGTFKPSATYPVMDAATDLVAGDFNGDGLIGLIVTDGDYSKKQSGAAILIANATAPFSRQSRF